ncbi:unnamed protein product, partial [Mesorhabditis belari]|uniref:Uncharacterized protein n=1 Tax=Mesorhabditis belari TaxID=2138241 RepID=A0AAF3JBL2_9BILA
MDDNGDFLPHIRLAKDLMDPRRYDSRVRPVIDHANRTFVLFSIDSLSNSSRCWNPSLYGGINVTICPITPFGCPILYIYNSVVMNREETERYINVVVTTKYYKDSGELK